MKTIKLTSACNIATGKLDSNAAVEDGEYPYFTCAPEPLRIDTYAFNDDAILLAGNNASGNFHCQRYNGKFNAYQRTYVITAKKGYDIDFIYYSLLINLQMFRNIAQGSQTKFLTMEILNGFELDDFTYEKQVELARILKDLDSKIAYNKSICSNLENIAKLIYDYWFIQFDFPDENGKPYKSSGGKMVWNDELKREIPAGWEVKTVSDLAAFKAESILPIKNVKYNHYSIPSFDDSNTPYCEYGEEIASNKYVVPNYCVLVSKLNPQFKRIWLILEPGENAICSTEFLPFTTDSKSIFYLYELLNSDLYSIHLKQKASSSTGSRKRIDSDNCLSFQTAYNKDVVELFNNEIAPLMKQINLIPFENQQLASLRDFLLPMLMNGQVKIQEESANA